MQEVEIVTRKLGTEDFVIVYFHWGKEYQYEPTGCRRSWRTLPLIQGQTWFWEPPHVLQLIEIYNDRYIVYSLPTSDGGNKRPTDFDTMIYQQAFLFDQNNNLVGIQAPEIIPCSVSSQKTVNDYRPSPVEGEAMERIFTKLNYGPAITEVMDLSVDKNEMVRLDEVARDIIIELKYATPDNITGKPVYDSGVAWLRRGTAIKLRKANEALMEQGYRIKVWDAYRSEEDHRLLFETENGYYFLDPKIGSNHTRGAAVDVTLVDSEGNELDMPSSSMKCRRKPAGTINWPRPDRRNATVENAMKEAGFIPLENEWWHLMIRL